MVERETKMTEVTKKYKSHDIVWYHPFPGERTPLRDTRYKAVVLETIDDLYYDYIIHILEESHPNKRKKVRAINLVEYNGNDVG